MPTFVALYRAVNVVGRNSVKMEHLRALHEELGHRQVRSYIQSGNVLFAAAGSPDAHAAGIIAAFAGRFGFSARLLILSEASLAAVVRGNPYKKHAGKNPRAVHAALCEDRPDAAALKALHTRLATTESFAIKGTVIYLHTPDGFGKSKFAGAIERAARVPMTFRNWRTIETLHKLIREPR